MPGSFKKAALQRRMRHLGNVSKIPSGHPQGNKPTFAGGGPMGRAAASQSASGGGFQGGHPYQAGAPSATGQKPSPPIAKGANNGPGPSRGVQQDMQLNKARLRTTQPFGLPAIKRRMGF